MEKEYIVISKKGYNVEDIDNDLGIETSNPNIPDRAVKKANAREGSLRMTHWWLTDEEAELIKKDPRVLSVEIPPEQRDDIVIGINAAQSANFYRGYQDNTQVNWGLRRCIEDTNIYAGAATVTGDYTHCLDGTGVDIVINDTGIQPDHEEFLDEDGNSRLKQIDWYLESGLPGTMPVEFYTDTDGHGTHVAGIAAGKTYGWAKGAHVYSMKFDSISSSTGIGSSEMFDLIRLWHLNKTNGRPTVVNMSWGSNWNITQGTITGGTYRGTAWTWGTEITTEQEAWDTYGVVPAYWTGPAHQIGAPNIVYEVELDEMIDAGIHICIAAGNNGNLKVLADDVTDYENTITTGIGALPYFKPGAPYSDRSFNVGNISNSQDGLLDKREYLSTNGPAVNIWAPGTSITSSLNGSSTAIGTKSGTSMASPQVAGVLALYLESDPTLSPENLLKKVIQDSKSVISDSGTNYSDDTSLNGSQNRMLKSRYNQEVSYTINSL